MTNAKKIDGTEQAWDEGLLGASEEYVACAPFELEAAVDAAIGMQAISIRLPKQLVDTYRLIGNYME